jgi:hypothetical protein
MKDPERDALEMMMFVMGAAIALLAITGVTAVYLAFFYSPIDPKVMPSLLGAVAWGEMQEYIRPVLSVILEIEVVIAAILSSGFIVTYWAHEHLDGKEFTYDDLTKLVYLAVPALLVVYCVIFGVMILVTLFAIVAFIFDKHPNSTMYWIIGGIVGTIDLLFYGLIYMSIWVRKKIKGVKARIRPVVSVLN